MAFLQFFFYRIKLFFLSFKEIERDMYYYKVFGRHGVLGIILQGFHVFGYTHARELRSLSFSMLRMRHHRKSQTCLFHFEVDFVGPSTMCHENTYTLCITIDIFLFWNCFFSLKRKEKMRAIIFKAVASGIIQIVFFKVEGSSLLI